MDNPVEVEGQDTALLTMGEVINVTWNPLSVIDNNLFQISTPKVDISLLRYKESDGEWEETAVLATDLSNNGRASVMLPNIDPLDESRPLDLTLIRMTLNTSTSITQSQPMKRSIRSRAWRAVKQFSKVQLLWLLEEPEESEESYVVERLLRKRCEVWSFDDRGVDERRIPPCPCRKDQADEDSRYEEETSSKALREYFHPGSKNCYRQRTAR